MSSPILCRRELLGFECDPTLPLNSALRLAKIQRVRSLSLCLLFPFVGRTLPSVSRQPFLHHFLGSEGCNTTTTPLMRCSYLFSACLAAFLSTGSALEITHPTSGSGIDPTRDLVITWSANVTDPSIIDLKITNSDPNALTTDMTLATGAVTYAGSYTVPANTIQNFGTGYQILAIVDGKTLAQVTGLVLGASSDQVSTETNGQLTFITTATNTAAPSAAVTTTSDGQEGSDGVSTSVHTATIESVGITTLTGTGTGSEATGSTMGTTTSRTTSNFVTSTASRSSSKSSAAAATSAQSTNTANGQKRLGGELVLSAAGVLAGVVALLA